MRISLIGVTNSEKLAARIGRPVSEIEEIARAVGVAVAEGGHELSVVFNYAGVLKSAGDAYKKGGGKLTMLYTEGNSDWVTKPYEKFLKEADTTVKKSSWHEALRSLVTDADRVICAGLSLGVFVELGYMRWNLEEGRGPKRLIGIKELLPNGAFPAEVLAGLAEIIEVVSYRDLAGTF